MTTENIEGAASLVFWTLTVILCVKYALIVLYADDNGQGVALLLPPLDAITWCHTQL